MNLEIVVRRNDGGLYKYAEGEWQCQHEETEWQTIVTYQPSQEQLDNGTDHDDEHEAEICISCGEVIE